MATQRFISTSFWDDEWVQTLDPSEKLLYLYLMTNPLTTIAGVYEITVRRMCFDTGFNTDTIKHILGKFEKAKKAFHHNGYIVIPAWPQHQKAETRPKIKEGIDAIINKLSKEMVEYIISVGYRYDIGTYTYVRNYSDSDIDTDIELEREKAPQASPTPEKLPHGEFGNIKLTDQEYRKLTDRYKKQDVDRVLETMGAWMKSKGKVYKDHYAALLNWIKKDGVQERGPVYQAPEPEQDEGLASPEEIAEVLARLPIKRFA